MHHANFRHPEVRSFQRLLTPVYYKTVFGHLKGNFNSIPFPCVYSVDVVHAYKNLLQEKEALEASITVLTANNQSGKSCKKDAAEQETKDDENEKLEDERVSAGKAEGVHSPVKEQTKERDGVVDHPLAVREDAVEDTNQSQLDKV